MTVAKKKHVTLALQGGGSHGAFTWGVLDRLLDEKLLEVEGISGTSAGAMNAAQAVHGFLQGGRKGAQQALDTFWRKIASYSAYSLIHRAPWDWFTGNWNIDDSPAVLASDMLTHLASPYQLNPMHLDPLRTVLEETLDFQAIRRLQSVKLFVGATNVRTGRIRVFTGADLSVDALLASACLPNVFRAIEIEGDPYWDGGYLGKPAIFPLIYECDCSDVLLVQVNPLVREGTPSTPLAILNRMTEITFNASLMAEMRAITFVKRLLETELLTGEAANRYKDMRIHMIDASEEMTRIGIASKMNAELDFLLHLRDAGRAHADSWLAATWDKIGHQTSINLQETFL